MIRLILTLMLVSISLNASETLIGVKYRSSPSLPEPTSVIRMIKKNNVSSVQIDDPDLLRYFFNSHISILFTISKQQYSLMAGNCSMAKSWVSDKLLRHHYSLRLNWIVVETDVLENTTLSQLSEFIMCIHQFLIESGIDGIKVSASFSFENIISHPLNIPSVNAFTYDSMSYVLHVLAKTKAPIFIDLHPYNLLTKQPYIPIGFGLFETSPHHILMDFKTKMYYHSLFEVMVDSVVHSIQKLGYYDIPVILSETGWPTYDSTNDYTIYAAETNFSKIYHQRLFHNLRLQMKTPYWQKPLDGVFVPLFDSHTSKHKSGVFHTNQTLKFDLDFSTSFPKNTTNKEKHQWNNENVLKDSVMLVFGIVFILGVYLCVYFRTQIGLHTVSTNFDTPPSTPTGASQ